MELEANAEEVESANYNEDILNEFDVLPLASSSEPLKNNDEEENASRAKISEAETNSTSETGEKNKNELVKREEERNELEKEEEEGDERRKGQKNESEHENADQDGEKLKEKNPTFEAPPSISEQNDELNNKLVEGITLLLARMAAAGSFTNIIEEMGILALHALGIDCYVICYPSVIQISPHKQGPASFRKVDGLYSANAFDIAQRTLEKIIKNPGKCKENNAEWFMKQIRKVESPTPLYSNFSMGLAWIACSVSINYLFFLGSATSVAFTAAASAATFLVAVLVPLFEPSLSQASSFLGMFFAALIAKLGVAVGIVDGNCLTGVVMSAGTSLLPGTSITLGAMDLVSGSFVQGSARLTGALAVAFVEGVAIYCAYYAVFWYPTPITQGNCPDTLDPLFIILFLPTLWMGWIISLDAPKKLWLPQLFSSLVSWGAWYGLGKVTPPVNRVNIDIIVATCIGVFAMCCQLFFGLSSFPIIVIGTYLLSVGSYTVLGVANTFLLRQ